MALDADRKNGPAARSFAADAHDCIMVRIKRPYRIQVCGTKMRPQWRAPLGFSKIDRHRQTLKLCRKKAPVAGHHRSACSGVKALRNTSGASRHAAKLCYRFGPLTPSARSANLTAGDGTKNGFPAPNKEPAKTKNDHLTGKAPYKSESILSSRESVEIGGRRCRPRGAHGKDCHPGYARRKNLRTKTLDPKTGTCAGRLGGASALGGGRQAERLVTENRDGG